MEGLSLNECALILCIVGALRSGERFFPSIDESLHYMKTGSWNKKEEEETSVNARQMSFFA